ncbi:MAG: hypothetical protein IJS71_04530 [Clostridia bacterium]|nr:hypothetical protein [Clostridia bacterium]
MKKFLTIVLAVVLALSCFAVPTFADEDVAAAAKGGDGFDFYSMTVHYTEPVVVSYKYVTKSDNIVKKDVNGNTVKDADGNDVIIDKAWIYADPCDYYIVPAIAFTNKDGTFTNFQPGYGEKEKGKDKTEEMFYCVVSPAYDMDSKGINKLKTRGLSDIGDNTAISIKSAATLYGPSEFYDDAGTPNPNFKLVDGYFLDKAVDADGNNLRIDINGYVIDANNIWHARDGHRIEPFVEVGENEKGEPILVWIDLESRVGADGKVLDYTTITNQDLIDKKVLTMPEKYATLADTQDPAVDYNEDGKIDTKDKRAYNSLVKEKEAWLTGCSIQMFTIDYIDLDGDGKKTESDMADYYDANKNEQYDEGEAYGYNNPKLVIEQKHIMTRTDKEGNVIYVQGSPAIGNPVTKVEIKNITVEIDALGDQLYADVASDPQQKNEIIITTGDIYKNIEKAQAYVAEHPEKMYTEGLVIGRAKCVTTKTEVAEAQADYPTTLKSVEVEITEGVEIPANATLYFNFFVQTQQPANEKTYMKAGTAKKPADNSLLPINKGEVNLERLPDNPEYGATAEPEPKKGCGQFIGGGIALVAVVGLAFVGFRKKED